MCPIRDVIAVEGERGQELRVRLVEAAGSKLKGAIPEGNESVVQIFLFLAQLWVGDDLSVDLCEDRHGNIRDPLLAQNQLRDAREFNLRGYVVEEPVIDKQLLVDHETAQRLFELVEQLIRVGLGCTAQGSQRIHRVD